MFAVGRSCWLLLYFVCMYVLQEFLVPSGHDLLAKPTLGALRSLVLLNRYRIQCEPIALLVKTICSTHSNHPFPLVEALH